MIVLQDNNIHDQALEEEVLMEDFKGNVWIDNMVDPDFYPQDKMQKELNEFDMMPAS